MDMGNPFEKMFGGNFKNPQPGNEGQFVEVNESEEKQLLEAAKMEAEGIILYVPLPQEVKEALLTKLSQVSESDIPELRSQLASPRGSTPQQCAGLIVNRNLRGVLDEVRNQITPREHELLTWAIDGLYCDPNSYTEKQVNEWMNGKSE